MDILISQTNAKAWTLISGAYTIEVYLGDSYANVYAGKARLGHGRTFHQDTNAQRLVAAIDSYKAGAIKAALQALAAHIG